MTGRDALIMWMGLSALACSPNMTDQPSYQPQEPPRLSSPSGSVPRVSRVHPSETLRAPDETEEQRRSIARLFRINCAHCHGSTGEGDGAVAPYLSHVPANLRAPHVQVKSDQALYRAVTNGFGAMPGFQGELSAEERWALVSWIKGLDGQKPESGKGTAPETAQQGKLLYATHCLACHGSSGRGDGPVSATMNPKPADLAGGRLKRGESLDAVVRPISSGIEGTAMPGFGHVSEQDRRALAGYVLSLRGSKQR